ncbi:MAG: hypothetical protein ACP5RI_03455 [Candidatus Micrarchaeia archaeon]
MFNLPSQIYSLQFTPSGTGDILTTLVILGFLIAAAIVAIWYIIGALLNNEKIKSGAKSELYQLVGTVVMIGILLALIYVFASLYSKVVTFPLQNNCKNLQSTDLYVIDQTLSAPVADGNTICDVLNAATSSQLSGSNGAIPLTELVDVPLAQTVVVTSSLTEQVAENFNMSFYLDGWLGFLSTMTNIWGVCGGERGTATFGAGCFDEEVSAGVLYQNTPYAGIDLIYKALGTISILLMTELAVFITQLIFENIFLYIWPYLLFLGIIFRATLFTRRLGGLLIAIAVGAILFYPVIFMTEYFTISNVESIAPQTISFCNGNYNYNVNFYQMPSIGAVATACYCYPTRGLFGEEIYAITGSLASQGIATGGTFVPFSDFSCVYSNKGGAVSITESTLFNLMPVYGLLGVIGYFVPIINILIVVSGITGLSGVLGGDTDLAGLSKLI